MLAAIALLAIAFAVGLSALGRVGRNASTAAHLNTAVERARSLLARQGLAAPLKNGALSGEFSDGMKWTLTIHAVPRSVPLSGRGADASITQPQRRARRAQTAAIRLYQLDVSVQYGNHRTLRLSTQRAQAARLEGNRE